MGFFDIFKKVDYKQLPISELEKYLTKELSPKKVTDIVDIQYAYLDKLFFNPKSAGGFGLPITQKDEIKASDLYRKCVNSLDSARLSGGIYKKAGQINNLMIEFARVFFQKGLRDIRRYTTRHFDQIELQWMRLQLMKDNVQLKSFCSKVLWNPNSYLFDKRMYTGDVDFICYKIKLCYQLYFEKEYGDDEISLDEFFSKGTQRELCEWVEEKMNDLV
ncbi:MAG: hypothetical protein E7367_04715 [Clostridiales bacterium]|nr:hypothetical protein [Clostridiales bacterium]